MNVVDAGPAAADLASHIAALIAGLALILAAGGQFLVLLLGQQRDLLPGLALLSVALAGWGAGLLVSSLGSLSLGWLLLFAHLAAPGFLWLVSTHLRRGVRTAYAVAAFAPLLLMLSVFFNASIIDVGGRLLQFGAALGAFALVITAGSPPVTGQRSRPRTLVAALRLPTLLLLLSSGLLALGSGWAGMLAALGVAVAATGVGLSMLRSALFGPLYELEDELRIINSDLRQTLSDLSAERARSEALHNQLIQATRTRSQFLDQLGHRLRTPLNSIFGYSELLASGVYGELNATQADRMGKLRRNAAQLVDLIDNMLEFNALEAGQLELHRSTFRLDDLLNALIQEMEAQCVEHGAAISLHSPPNLPPIYGDGERIARVFRQLIDNALKFSTEAPGQTSIRIEIALVRVAGGRSDDFELPVAGWLSDGLWAVSAVIDNGIGIAPQEQARIFDEFFQTGDPRAAEYSGSGLGLAIAKRLVMLHDGAIWVKSAPKQGSTFYVALRAAASNWSL
ncbi:MAG: HAMP domain-containing sensor histidine kinase [Aggregatilineales bacterium]